jgi:hypothetical protein
LRIVAILAALLLALPFIVPWFIFRPEPLDASDPGRWGLPQAQAITFAADDNILTGWWLEAPDEERPVILIAHGRSANMAKRASIAARLSRDGFGVLMFDYRGYGGSQGSPTEAGIETDALAAYDWLRTQGIAAKRIILVGQSLGGAPAARVAAERPVRGLVLVSPYTNLPEAAAWSYPWLPLAWIPWPRNRFEVAARLKERNIPIALIASRSDGLVPLGNSEELARTLKRSPIWVMLDPVGHDGLLTAAAERGLLSQALREVASR